LAGIDALEALQQPRSGLLGAGQGGLQVKTGRGRLSGIAKRRRAGLGSCQQVRSRGLLLWGGRRDDGQVGQRRAVLAVLTPPGLPCGLIFIGIRIGACGLFA
jgi:hypothetical protein